MVAVYDDTPFYACQDKIISFSVCAYIGLGAVLLEGQSTLPYWLQTLMIFAYLIILVVLYTKDRNEDVK